MGKATNPRTKRQAANDQQQDGIERINGVDHNRQASPLVYWRSKKMISSSQDAAIEYALRIWELVGLKPKTTASYGERTTGSCDGGESGRLILKRMRADDDLKRIKGYVPSQYWSIFENCIRHDEPAGIAGSRLGFGSRTSKERAHTIVCMVADTIAMNERLGFVGENDALTA